MAILGGFVLVVALMVVSAICNGYALSVLWGWFIVPVFNLPQLSIPVAIGVALVVGYLTKQETNSSDTEDKSFGELMAKGFAISIAKPAVALLFGWVVHFFI